MTLDPLPRKHQAINYLTFVQAPKLFPKKDKNHTLSVTLSISLSLFWFFKFRSKFLLAFKWRSGQVRSVRARRISRRFTRTGSTWLIQVYLYLFALFQFLMSGCFGLVAGQSCCCLWFRWRWSHYW